MLSVEFLLSSLLVVASPGAGVVYTVATALQQGRRAALWASLGCALGVAPHLGATVLGVAALLHSSALAFQLLKLAGAAYLLWLAVATWRDRSAFCPGPARPPLPGHRVVAQAVALNLLNPKLTLFCLAWLPQFVQPERGAAAAQLLGLGAVFMGLTGAVFAAYGLAAHALRRQVLGSARWQGALRAGFAAGFAGLGLRLGLADH